VRQWGAIFTGLGRAHFGAVNQYWASVRDQDALCVNSGFVAGYGADQNAADGRMGAVGDHAEVCRHCGIGLFEGLG
jgi:hypothetical protein